MMNQFNLETFGEESLNPETTGISFIAVKSSDAVLFWDGIISDVFNKDIEVNETRERALSSISEENRVFIHKVLANTELALKLPLARNSESLRAFWEVNYSDQSEQYFYDVLMNALNIDTFLYVLYHSGSQSDLDQALGLLKGTTEVVKTNDAESKVYKKGKGLRGFTTSKAVIIKADAVIASLIDNPQLLEALNIEGDEILFPKLPYDVQKVIFGMLSEQDQTAMLNLNIHSPDNIDRVFQSILAISYDYLSVEVINEILANTSNATESTYWLLASLSNKL